MSEISVKTIQACLVIGEEVLDIYGFVCFQKAGRDLILVDLGAENTGNTPTIKRAGLLHDRLKQQKASKRAQTTSTSTAP